MKTFNAKEEDTIRQWWIVDAAGKNLGRISTEIARVLRGKHKPQFTPYADIGDFVVVINADKVAMTGKKWIEKNYYWHSRFFGSLRSKNATEMRDSDPTFIIEQAVKGMLPNNKLSNRLIGKLKAYSGGTHPHAAQNPQVLNIN